MTEESRFIVGCNAIKLLKDALGIRAPVRRIIVDCEPNKVTHIYVDAYADSQAIKDLSDLLKQGESPR